MEIDESKFGEYLHRNMCVHYNYYVSQEEV